MLMMRAWCGVYGVKSWFGGASQKMWPKVTSAPCQAAFLVRVYLAAMVLLEIPGARGDEPHAYSR